MAKAIGQVPILILGLSGKPVRLSFLLGSAASSYQRYLYSGDPLSFYINNGNVDTITLKYIQAKSIQTFFLHEALENSSTEPLIFENESLTITEAVTVAQALAMAVSVNDALAITESQTVVQALAMAYNNNDALTITESITVGTPA